MSSYHSSFKYLDKDSMKDFGWIITHFDADEGEVDSYLSQEQIYSDTYRGTRRILYGTKWNSVSTIKITVVKKNGADFSVAECRNAYRWLTGNPTASWLDLCVGDAIKYSFLCTTQDVKPQKLDARTVGLNIYFESISPFAYSPIQTFNCSFGQTLAVDNGVLYEESDAGVFGIDDGVVYGAGTLSVTDDGTVYVDNSVVVEIDNQTDDLYTPIYLNTTFTNNNSDYVSIKNETTGEETIITKMSQNEIITLSAEQFIVSDITGKIFGNTFNFVWPRLVPGVNKIVISGSGNGSVSFSYRYPMKVSDCVIDIDELNSVGCDGYADSDTSNGGTSSSGNASSGSTSSSVSWSNVTDKPTTIAGYGITDAYTTTEVDDKIADVESAAVDEAELKSILNEIFGE